MCDIIGVDTDLLDSLLLSKNKIISKKKSPKSPNTNNKGKEITAVNFTNICQYSILSSLGGCKFKVLKYKKALYIDSNLKMCYFYPFSTKFNPLNCFKYQFNESTKYKFYQIC